MTYNYTVPLNKGYFVGYFLLLFLPFYAFCGTELKSWNEIHVLVLDKKPFGFNESRYIDMQELYINIIYWKVYLWLLITDQLYFFWPNLWVQIVIYDGNRTIGFCNWHRRAEAKCYPHSPATFKLKSRDTNTLNNQLVCGPSCPVTVGLTGLCHWWKTTEYIFLLEMKQG